VTEHRSDPEDPREFLPDSRPDHRETALAALTGFGERLLPGMLRRVMRWRGLSRFELRDLHEDILQELRLDCLEHAAEICRLTPRERHARWFRLAERWLYHYRLRGNTEPLDADRPPVAAAVPGGIGQPVEVELALGGVTAATTRQLLDGLRTHDNGRCHVSATARRLSISPRRLRRTWNSIARALGFDEEFLTFWRRRLAEAMAGLAADLLRDADRTRLLHRPRQCPDPRGRLRRIRRIQDELSILPLPPELRSALALVRAADLRDPELPARVLATAEQLAPDLLALAAWRFEATLAVGDLRGAAKSLRRARALGLRRTASSLARARLHEARGRWNLAQALLRRHGLLHVLGPQSTHRRSLSGDEGRVGRPLRRLAGSS
jgi:hypothetical protein